jgi:hypothetical protein
VASFEESLLLPAGVASLALHADALVWIDRFSDHELQAALKRPQRTAPDEASLTQGCLP